MKKRQSFEDLLERLNEIETRLIEKEYLSAEKLEENLENLFSQLQARYQDAKPIAHSRRRFKIWFEHQTQKIAKKELNKKSKREFLDYLSYIIRDLIELLSEVETLQLQNYSASLETFYKSNLYKKQELADYLVARFVKESHDFDKQIANELFDLLNKFSKESLNCDLNDYFKEGMNSSQIENGLKSLYKHQVRRKKRQL